MGQLLRMPTRTSDEQAAWLVYQASCSQAYKAYEAKIADAQRTHDEAQRIFDESCRVYAEVTRPHYLEYEAEVQKARIEYWRVVGKPQS